MTNEVQASLVRGWQLNRGMGFAILTFGVDAQGPNGETGIVPSPNFLLSEEYCRQLAQQLVEQADRLKVDGGSA
ncbi:hypothetical protein ACFSTI_20820 [Rhizorhabdus histidinilytica]|uniref:hypothetical protein n=2 Tax=Rhizorhabdus histidinilytica TaxID=439228 RepID=UPI00158FF65D|nr:hypothetical protein [Rhizorhabdus histidinilytica]